MKEMRETREDVRTKYPRQGSVREQMTFLWLPRRLSDGRYHWLTRAVKVQVYQIHWLNDKPGSRGFRTISKLGWETVRVDRYQPVSPKEKVD